MVASKTVLNGFLLFLGLVSQFYLSASPYESYIKRDKDGYKVNPGDTIEIRVLNENECSINTKINPNGHIRLVYIGMIEVTGLSVSQIEVKIRNEYINQKIFRNPTVIVEITSYSPKYVYISGSVNKSGPFALPNEANAISITELINMSGGFNPIANKKKVSVTRTFRDKAQNVVETKVYVVDVEALSNGTTNIKGQKWWIYPGDQINVPERLF